MNTITPALMKEYKQLKKEMYAIRDWAWLVNQENMADIKNKIERLCEIGQNLTLKDICFSDKKFYGAGVGFRTDTGNWWYITTYTKKELKTWLEIRELYIRIP